jgi:uncharacterized membrane protein YeaQ/YmgE (transglycosylase-associated protein family)
MSIGSIIIFLIVGAVAGWLAGLVVKGRGFGLVGDIIIGYCRGWGSVSAPASIMSRSANSSRPSSARSSS